MATNYQKDLEGKPGSNYAVVHDIHFYSEARHDVDEKEEERKTRTGRLVASLQSKRHSS
jgi:hypothetical protein